MRKILVPTDFSSNANDALNYALQLAAPFGAEIVLAHILLEDDFPGMEQERNPIDTQQEQQLRERLGYQARQAQDMAGLSVTLSTRLVRGSFVKAALQAVEQEQCDLVILGTKGASGLRKTFVGSNATDLMEYTHVPLVAVPAGYTFAGINTIMLSLDMNHPESQGPHVRLVRLFAETFSAEVVVLSLGAAPGPNARQAQTELSQALGDVPINYLMVPEGSPTRNIEEYTRKLKPQMLVLQPHRKSVWQLFFGKSVTREILFRPEVPVLVMPVPDEE